MRLSSGFGRLFRLGLVAAGLWLGVSPAGAAGGDDEVVVRYRAGAAVARGALSTEAVAGGAIARVAVPPGTAEAAARAARAEPGVLWATPNRRLARLQAGDPSGEPLRGRQWHLDLVRADGAWRFTKGDPRVWVGVIDSGIDAAHPDRPAHVVIGPSFTSAAPTDHQGHGTHVAGVIGAAANGIGTVGLAPKTTVVALKVDDDAGVIRVFDVYRAIVWAADNGVDIVNLSLGLPGDSPALREAVEYAQARNVLIVAAAGNSAESGNPVIYPAAYPGVLAVGAVDRVGGRAAYSQFGPYLGLMAPGGTPEEPVVGPLPGGGYGGIAGTSVAAPQAAAAAALVWAADPELTAAGVRERLLATARDVGAAGVDEHTGRGLLDAEAAVRAALSPYRAAWRGGTCPTIVSAGARSAMTFELANAGTEAWRRDGANPVRIGTDRPVNRESAFFAPGSWLSPNRAAGLPAESVAPGTTARFDVPLQAPAAAGVYREYFRPMAEGLEPMRDLGIYCDVTVVPSTPWLAADGEVTAPAVVRPGQTVPVRVRIRNVGTATWRRDGDMRLRLGTSQPRDRASALYDARTWLAPDRVGGPTTAEVAPGEFATFEFAVVAPRSAGRYEERFAAVLEGMTWLNHEVVVGFEVRR